jgi:hypothetical protein
MTTRSNLQKQANSKKYRGTGEEDESSSKLSDKQKPGGNKKWYTCTRAGPARVLIIFFHDALALAWWDKTGNEDENSASNLM